MPAPTTAIGDRFVGTNAIAYQVLVYRAPESIGNLGLDYNFFALSASLSITGTRYDNTLKTIDAVIKASSYLLGRKNYARELYPLANPFGFNSATVLAGSNWDTLATKQSLVTQLSTVTPKVITQE